MVVSDVALTDAETITVTVTSVTVPPIVIGPDPLDGTKTALLITGTEGPDQVFIYPGPTQAQVTVHLNGVVSVDNVPTGHVVVNALGGNDSVFQTSTVPLPAIF